MTGSDWSLAWLLELVQSNSLMRLVLCKGAGACFSLFVCRDSRNIQFSAELGLLHLKNRLSTPSTALHMAQNMLPLKAIRDMTVQELKDELDRQNIPRPVKGKTQLQEAVRDARKRNSLAEADVPATSPLSPPFQ